MPSEQGELCSGVSAVVILNNRSLQHVPTKVFKGVSPVFPSWKLGHMQLWKKLEVKQCLSSHIQYCTSDFEIYGRSNFHIGQQTVISEIALSVKDLMGAFMPCKTVCVSEGHTGERGKCHLLKSLFLLLTGFDQTRTRKGHFDNLCLEKMSCVVNSISWDPGCLSFWIF